MTCRKWGKGVRTLNGKKREGDRAFRFGWGDSNF